MMGITRTGNFFPLDFSAALITTAHPRPHRDSRTSGRVRRPVLQLPKLRLVAAWAVGLVVTLLILWDPFRAFGLQSRSIHLVLGSVEACVALGVAYLLHCRFVNRRRLQDLLLAQGLILLAAASLGLTYLVGPYGAPSSGAIDIWLPVVLRVLGALLIATAALTRGRLASHSASRYLSTIVPGAMIVALSSILWIAKSQLPIAFDLKPGIAPSLQPLLTGHPLFLVAQGVGIAALFIASIAFASQSARHDDDLFRWFGPACALGAFARIDYTIFPSLYSDWVYTGDLLGAGCYLLLLMGAVHAIRRYLSAQASVAVVDDRLRTARELHDGVIQEIAYIRLESQSIAGDPTCRKHIVGACDRALDEARGALQTLGRTNDEPLSSTLSRALAEMAERYGFALVVDLDNSIEADSDQQHALTRIVREAVSNAVHHGKATSMRVSLLSAAGSRHMTIEDNGTGFDVSAVHEDGGYGLTSMRERARTLPGLFEVAADLGLGSQVTVRW
jgi:signal transduction histidine kinase